MARLEQAIVSIVDLFLEYSREEGKKRQLNKEELRKLLTEQIESSELKEALNPDDIDEVMKTLDKNHDDDINFREFCRCVSELAKGYYHKKKGKGGKKGKEKDGE
ncbi:protein S100-B-like [Symphorus nematophorus]